ncbi:MAG: SLC13 family permease [Bacteroidaceae bacterium]|nr:SLC13 family permease [Bacteroidaceae bacterium]
MEMLFLGLSGAAWFVVLVVILVFVLQLCTKLPSDFVFLGGMALLLVSGVIPANKVLGGFSSSTVVLIGVLFVVIKGLVQTGFMQWVVRYCLGTPKNYHRAIARLMLPVAALSSFLNNTTVVALFTGVVRLWSKKMGIPPSKLLIPLSYASGMGGICTLIGTPPNLLISGFYTNETGVVLSIFTPTLVGLFCLFVGVLSTIALSRFIPVRQSPEDALEGTDSYTVELLVPTMSPLVCQTLKETGLHNVDGGHLIEIIRMDREIVTVIDENEFIFGGDRLIFSGNVEKIMALREKYQLVNATHHVFSLDEMEKNRKMQMVTVGFKSSLIGSRLCDNSFEEENNLVLVAIAREGTVVDGSPREVELKAGDTLLLECSNNYRITPNSGYDLTEVESTDFYKPDKRTFFSSVIMILMVVISSLGYMTLLQAAFVAAFAMIICRFCSIEQARESIDWRLLMIFAGSISLGTAIQETGIAEWISQGILVICDGSPYVALIGVCLVATFITEFTSNTATAAIFFPIAYQTAVNMDVNPLTFCVALMIAVSSSFATPIGSPTHMIVYGPGGYRFADFARIGLPMNFIILATNIFITLLLFPL